VIAGYAVLEEMAQSPSEEKRCPDKECPERRLEQKISQRTPHRQCRPCAFKTLKVCADPVATLSQAVASDYWQKSLKVSPSCTSRCLNPPPAQGAVGIIGIGMGCTAISFRSNVAEQLMQDSPANSICWVAQINLTSWGGLLQMGHPLC